MTSSGSPSDATPLRRMKAWALAALLAMLAGFILSHVMGGQGVWAWVRAFCEAATVGALADWFAVTALFRRPLGLPLPRTAVIPRSKARIGQSLAGFVREQFLDPAMLLERLRVFDPAARLGQWLSAPGAAQTLGRSTRQLAVESLDLVDEKAVRAALQAVLVDALRRWDLARSAGDVLGLLTRDGRHQALLDAALRRLSVHLDSPEVRTRVGDLLASFARREWPRTVGVMDRVMSVDGMADNLARRLAEAMMDELATVMATPEHPMRANYEAWLQDYIERLRTDPALGAQVARWKDDLINHPDLQLYLQQLWGDVRQVLRRDLLDDDSAVARQIDAGLAALGQRLADDPALRTVLNEHLLGAAERLADELRDGLTGHIVQTVERWDERDLVGKLEDVVGKDLQYIRLNGTLVGGAIGLALHALVLGVQALS